MDKYDSNDGRYTLTTNPYTDLYFITDTMKNYTTTVHRDVVLALYSILLDNNEKGMKL